MRILWLLCILLSLSSSIWAQTNWRLPSYTPCSQTKSDSLELVYGGNTKVFLAPFKQASLLALAHYPTLKNTKIIFRYGNGKTSLTCRPKLSTLHKKQRTYYIRINRKKFADSSFLRVPFNAQVGVIGHELAHIVDYENLRSKDIIHIGLRYGNKNFKKEYERRIDSLTITHGLGPQLYDWAQYILSDCTHCSKKYKKYKQTFYMQPQEIKQQSNL